MRLLPLSFLLIAAIFSSGYRFRCFLFCTEQTGTQNDYAEARSDCEDYASAKLDDAMKGSANADSEKEQQAKLVALLSECMAKKGWDVPSGSKGKEKTTVANIPTGESLLGAAPRKKENPDAPVTPLPPIQTEPTPDAAPQQQQPERTGEKPTITKIPQQGADNNSIKPPSYTEAQGTSALANTGQQPNEQKEAIAGKEPAPTKPVPAVTQEQKPAPQPQQQQLASEPVPAPANLSSVPTITKRANSQKQPEQPLAQAANKAEQQEKPIIINDSKQSTEKKHFAGPIPTVQSAPVQRVTAAPLDEGSKPVANVADQEPALSAHDAAKQSTPTTNAAITNQNKETAAPAAMVIQPAPIQQPTAKEQPTASESKTENTAKPSVAPKAEAQQPIVQPQPQQIQAESALPPAGAGSTPKITKNLQEHPQPEQARILASTQEANSEMNNSAVKKSAECAFARSSAKASPRAAIKAEECDMECAEKLKIAKSGVLPAACPEAVYK